jgi:DNA-binding IclR family transcriptional regulator
MTSRAALAATRSLDILDYLAAHPDQGHTMTELARGLDVNPSSMHGILGVMTEAGYVVRHPAHKTYRLGPIAAAIGQAAAQQDPVIELALQEVDSLTREFDVESVVLTVARDEMVVVGRSGPATGRFLSFIGQRWQHSPPMGSIFVAWSTQASVDRWLGATEPALDETSREGFRDVLRTVRANGQAVVVVVDNGWHLAVNDESPKPARGGYIVPLTPGQSYRVFYIGQPVFNALGDVVVGLFVNGPSARLTVDRINEISQRLADSATRIMSRTGGRVPAPVVGTGPR